MASSTRANACLFINRLWHRASPSSAEPFGRRCGGPVEGVEYQLPIVVSTTEHAEVAAELDDDDFAALPAPVRLVWNEPNRVRGRAPSVGVSESAGSDVASRPSSSSGSSSSSSESAAGESSDDSGVGVEVDDEMLAIVPVPVPAPLPAPAVPAANIWEQIHDELGLIEVHPSLFLRRADGSRGAEVGRIEFPNLSTLAIKAICGNPAHRTTASSSSSSSAPKAKAKLKAKDRQCFLMLHAIEGTSDRYRMAPPLPLLWLRPRPPPRHSRHRPRRCRSGWRRQPH